MEKFNIIDKHSFFKIICESEGLEITVMTPEVQPDNYRADILSLAASHPSLNTNKTWNYDNLRTFVFAIDKCKPNLTEDLVAEAIAFWNANYLPLPLTIITGSPAFVKRFPVFSLN